MTFQQSLFNNTEYEYWKASLTITKYMEEGVSINSSSSLSFKINKVPVNGTCMINLKNGTALYTLFTIICDDWVDPDGKITRYEYMGNFNLFNFFTIF